MKSLVTIVGLGAVGSPVAHTARNWEEDLRLIDFDTVEMKNTQAQEYPVMSRGRNKAQASAQGLQAQWKRKVKSIPHKLTEQNVQQLLGGAALIIDCTDNIAARQLIQDFAKANDTPCLHGCLSAEGDFARIVWTEHFTADAEANDGAPTCEDGELLPFYSLVGARISLEAQRFLKDGTKRSFQITPTSYLRIV